MALIVVCIIILGVALLAWSFTPLLGNKNPVTTVLTWIVFILVTWIVTAAFTREYRTSVVTLEEPYENVKVKVLFYPEQTRLGIKFPAETR